MILDSRKLNGPCACGRNHVMNTRAAVIEEGCLEKFETYLEEYGITGKRAAVYDENTYHAKNLVRPKAEQEIILNPENLHDNELAT